MSTESEGAKLTLLIIKGAISDLPEEQRKTVERLADSIRKIIETSELGPVALALLGAEYSAKED